MKVLKKIAAAAISSVMLLSIAGLQANAATVTQDGLNVSLTTDKTEYKKNEAITATLTVENTGGTSVKDVKLENILPDGYELAKDYSLTKSVKELKSKDKAELKVVYNAKAGGNVTPNNNTVTPSTNSGATVETVKTGDSTQSILFAALMLASVSIGILCFKKKKGKEFLSIALCVSVLGTIIAVVPFEADATQNASKSISITENITCNNKNLTLKSIISYLFDGSTSDKNKVGEISYKQIDSKHIVYDEAEKIYYIDNRLLLTAVEGSSKSNIESLIANYQGKIVGCIELTDDYQIEFDNKMTKEQLQNIVDILKKSTYVYDCYIDEVSEPQFDMIPDDSEWSNEDWIKKDGNDINWGVEAIDAMDAWDYYDRMETINIGIIDSMFDKSHEDLNFKEIWNNPVNILKENDYSKRSHGTHVLGTMAATFNNKIGIAGIAPKTDIYAYSILGEQTDAQLNSVSVFDYLGFKYALANLITNDCKVINVSMSNHSDIEKQAEIYGDYLSKLIAKKYEFVIVQSAGNYGHENVPGRLAENNGIFTGIDIKEVKDRIIVVGAAGNNLNSNSFGDRVDVLAPGVKIYSTVPSINKYENSFVGNKGIRYWDGTSMAAPHVSGIAAMCFSINKNLTGTQVKDIIKSTVDNTPIYRTVNGQEDKSIPYYMVNANNAVNKALNYNSSEPTEVKNGTVIGKLSLNTGDTINYSDVKVIARINSGSQYETNVDSTGSFTLVLKPGKYEIVISYPEYKNYTIRDIMVEKGKTKIIDEIILEKDKTYTALELIDKNLSEISEIAGGKLKCEMKDFSVAFGTGGGTLMIYNDDTLPGIAFHPSYVSGIYKDFDENKNVVSNIKNGKYDYDGIAVYGSGKLNRNISADMTYNEVSDFVGYHDCSGVAQNTLMFTADVDGYQTAFYFSEYDNQKLNKLISNGIVSKEDMKSVNPKLSSIAVYRKNKNSDTWRTAYKEFLSEKTVTTNSYAFDLYDMNDDGIPELFFSEGYWHVSACRVYSFINGKIESLNIRGAYGEVYIDKNKKIIVAEGQSNGNGGLWEEYSKINADGTVTNENFGKVQSNNSTEYYYNNQLVSKEEYDSKAKYYEDINPERIGRGNNLTKEKINSVIDNYK